MREAVLAAYTARPNALEHHRFTNEMLGIASPLRGELDKFAAGAPLCALSPEFQRKRCELKFVPIVERIIEGKHSLVKRALPGKNKKHSAVTVSLASGRLLEFQRHVIVNPEVYVRVADCVDRVRNSRQQITAFRLADHPAVQALMRSHEYRPPKTQDRHDCR